MDDNGDVIELINKLQSHGQTTGCKIDIQLPQIVVVGAQSSGKSSVLDGLVGSSILPRGSGTVTKCPIIVQLKTTKEGEEEGIEFQDDPEAGRIKDYDVVRNRINDKMQEGGGAITDTPIIIRVFSPNVVTLTVVDLPGIKRLTSSGEPSDLEQLIFNLSRKYINEKNAIILAVSPANYDICNSDGILLAKEADPKGDRTIGVLTKLDLMDEGTDARDLLTGTSKDVNVKLGMVGLVNRSQKDIDNNVTVEVQLEKEKSFLAKTYPDLAEINGVPYLRKRLHDLLVQHILKCLPDILRELQGLMETCDKKLEAIPDVMSVKDKYAFVNKVIYTFENNVKTELDGSTRSPEYNYLYGGIKIKDIFDNQFASAMEDAGKESDASISDKMIENAFRNSGGFDSFFAYPEAVFRRLAQNQLKYIEKPAIQCAELVHEEILLIADRHLNPQLIETNYFQHFSELRKTIRLVINDMLENKLDELKKQIKDYIQVQASIVFSLDKNFLQEIGRLRKELEKCLYGENLEEEEEELDLWHHNAFSGLKRQTVDLIKEMVTLYFNHIKSQTQDYIPKLVAHRLVNQFSSDGRLGGKLRAITLERYEELASLPLNIGETRRKAAVLKEHLKEVILDVKGILNSHRYDGLTD